MFYLGKNSKENIKGVDQRLIAIVNQALSISLIDFGIPRDGGVRSDARQLAMFIDPNIKTNCDGIEHRSKHQDGLAIDFYAYIDGKASWDETHLSHVACSLLQAASQLGVKVKWGGFFKPDGWDKGHLEIAE